MAIITMTSPYRPSPECRSPFGAGDPVATVFLDCVEIHLRHGEKLESVRILIQSQWNDFSRPVTSELGWPK
jgi:hypothetical protein